MEPDSGPADADLVVRGVPIATMDPDQPWAEALAVQNGRILAVGDASAVAQVCGPATRVVEPDAAMVLPGLVDVHTHVGFAGRQAVWELSLSPIAGLADVLAAVRERAARIDPDEWVVGGIIGGAVLDAVGDRDALNAVDAASLGRPVMLRDDSMHNRWSTPGRCG